MLIHINTDNISIRHTVYKNKNKNRIINKNDKNARYNGNNKIIVNGYNDVRSSYFRKYNFNNNKLKNKHKIYN